MAMFSIIQSMEIQDDAKDTALAEKIYSNIWLSKQIICLRGGGGLFYNAEVIWPSDMKTAPEVELRAKTVVHFSVARW